ncbi:ribonuclease HII [Candidatus Uhrbacteria bacterium]|nr:ribonuclease HII [Candidatus Uhrbacteria bacterium]
MILPTFHHERALLRDGYFPVGVDEVGCGCLAGPVVTAAMHLPLQSRLPEVRDSKLLSPKQRERLAAVFAERGYRWTIGAASVEEIDRLHIRQATYLAMRRAITAFLDAGYATGSAYALIDAWTLPDLPIPQRGIIRGDALVKSIAAASIVAKVARDRLMCELHEQYPAYGFAIHKGYATAVHRAAILQHGLTPLHRRSFCDSFVSLPGMRAVK